MYLRQKHPRIHLVFVPANCTSKLQVADVTLQRPFKPRIREAQLFNNWAAQQTKEQIASGSDKLVGFAGCFKMALLKPLVLQWCIVSWQRLADDKVFVTQGWYKCCSSFFNVNDPQKRKAALAAVARKESHPHDVPSGIEDNPRDDVESDYETDASGSDQDDKLDTSKTINFGDRRSTRAPRQRFGGGINPLQIALTEDSENWFMNFQTPHTEFISISIRQTFGN
jgi:hypothetical protein